jgi:hypothetical protein
MADLQHGKLAGNLGVQITCMITMDPSNIVSAIRLQLQMMWTGSFQDNRRFMSIHIEYFFFSQNQTQGAWFYEINLADQLISKQSWFTIQQVIQPNQFHIGEKTDYVRMIDCMSWRARIRHRNNRIQILQCVGLISSIP